jgi:hypothetical protein
LAGFIKILFERISDRFALKPLATPNLIHKVQCELLVGLVTCLMIKLQVVANRKGIGPEIAPVIAGR